MAVKGLINMTVKNALLSIYTVHSYIQPNLSKVDILFDFHLHFSFALDATLLSLLMALFFCIKY